MNRGQRIAIPLLAAAAVAVCSGTAAAAVHTSLAVAQQPADSSGTQRGGFGNWLPWAVGAVTLFALARGE